MSTPYLGEIKLFAGNFTIRGYAPCDGRLLNISEYDALFALLGTTYGGDGQTTFAVPDLRGRLPLHQGSGTGLTTRFIGEAGGSETVTLIANQLPAHNHVMNASTGGSAVTSPDNAMISSGGLDTFIDSRSTPASLVQTSANGNSQAHENMMPFLTVTFLIALEGIFPPR